MAIAQTTGRAMTSLRCFLAAGTVQEGSCSLPFISLVRIDKTARIISYLSAMSELYT